MSFAARLSPRRRLLSRLQHRHKERVLTQHAPAKIGETASAIVLKVDEIFLLTDVGGDAPCDTEHGLGLYFRDCRFLDEYELLINGESPTVLSAAAARGYETRHDLANPEFKDLPKNTVGIRRQRLVRDGALIEIITVRNFGLGRARFQIALRFGSAFEDIFMLRGYVPRSRGHRLLPPRVDRDRVRLRSEGLDGATRTTTLAFAPVPDELDARRASYELALEPAAQLALTIHITPSVATEPARQPADGAHVGRLEMEALSNWFEEQDRAWLSQWSEVRSSNALFDAILARGLRDLRVLRTSLEGLHYEAAGVPWFATLFGRDSAIVGIQTLAYGTPVARDTLRLLARFQATHDDPYRDAEPGKILHELRSGELARAKLVPQSPAYYGTVDATFLFLILLAEYFTWSGDEALVRELEPNLRAALEWTLTRADHDGDGFLDYTGAYEHGLVNQGWKDSGNAVMNADGSLARPPIAVVEVQAYAHRAWRDIAALLRRLGREESLASDLERRALELRERFEQRYWSEELDCYVLALQGDGEPCAVVSSNAGQALWGEIASAEHARRVAARMLDDDMFSGWGIRTLSSSARAYNPIGYHIGSVWPHDNAMILSGFRKYGQDKEAARIFDALVSAAAGMRDYRMPELYCGYARKPDEHRPVEYPVACAPQAWAAGSVPYALRRMLGLEADAASGVLRVIRPQLPPSVDWLELRGVHVGAGLVDLRFRRDGDRVSWDGEAVRGDIDLEKVTA